MHLNTRVKIRVDTNIEGQMDKKLDPLDVMLKAGAKKNDHKMVNFLYNIYVILLNPWTVKYRSKSTMDTAVWDAIPKWKLIPSIITVAFMVLGKWPGTSKYGLMQMFTNWWMNGQMEGKQDLY